MGVMTLLQLKYIVKIVECGSMNEASHELYVSQPALSSSVKELENELGIEIFTRSSQGIALTVDGAEFLTYARQVLDQASLLEERYKNAKPRKQLCSVSTQHYMFAVEAFVEMIDSTKSDEYEFTIRETRTKDIINLLPSIKEILSPKTETKGGLAELMDQFRVVDRQQPRVVVLVPVILHGRTFRNGVTRA